MLVDSLGLLDLLESRGPPLSSSKSFEEKENIALANLLTLDLLISEIICMLAMSSLNTKENCEIILKI